MKSGRKRLLTGIILIDIMCSIKCNPLKMVLIRFVPAIA